MKKSILKEVQQQMQEMTSKKTAELDAIREKQSEAQSQKEAAEQAIKDATARMDLDGFEEAKQAKRKAQTAMDMYAGRYKQIQQQEYISEAASDEVIDSLLAYEDELEADFKEAIVEPLKQLEDLQKAYFDAIAETEQTILTWTETIHANYRSKTTTFRETGTNRSPRPIPVRMTAFEGCPEANRLRDFLTKFEA